MSRIRYADDETAQSPGLFDANLRRAIAGRRGQRALRDLIAGLEALPEKKLLADDRMGSTSGEVCAVGAYTLYKAAQRDFVAYDGRQDYLDHLSRIEDDFDTIHEAERYGMTRTLAWIICEMNDEFYDRHSPEERYAGILRWARERLVEEAAA